MSRFDAQQLAAHREPLDRGFAGRGSKLPGEHLDRRALAGAVGAQKAEEPPGRDPERRMLVDGCLSAEDLRETSTTIA
jgi:hypothetical protein